MPIFRSRFASFVVWIDEKPIRFNNGLFETTDEELANKLRSLQEFGVSLFEEEEVKKVEVEEIKENKEVKKRGRPKKQ